MSVLIIYTNKMSDKEERITNVSTQKSVVAAKYGKIEGICSRGSSN
jgi:hypothetical protein